MPTAVGFLRSMDRSGRRAQPWRIGLLIVTASGHGNRIMAGLGSIMRPGGGLLITMGDGFGMAATAGAGGLVPGCQRIFGVRRWWVSSAGETEVLDGLRLRPTKGSSLGGVVEVIIPTGQAGLTACGM